MHDDTEASGGDAFESTPGERSGDRIDRYTLIEEVGAGGMGTVWLAEQSEPVSRQVALKIIKLGMDTREVVVRFEAERQALALMDHPHIAKVLDGGATAAGRPYFVMELVEGVPITEFCDQRRLGLRARLELFTRVCEAIQHAHHKGIIHRDVKPSNVLVAEQDGGFVPKVIDFGIAKATSAELTQQTMVTQHDQIVGTPEYMSPEQAAIGDGEDIDTRADVYSLGVLLYELLTGTTPFDVREILKRGYLELLRMIREVDPERPSTRVSTVGGGGGESDTGVPEYANVRKLSLRLRGELDWIVMKAIEKDRARRYETANGLAADVSRFLRDEPVVAVPPSAAYRLRKFVRRQKKLVAAVGTIAVLLVAGSVGTGLGWYESRVANAALTKAIDELEQVSSFQAAQLGGLDVQLMGVRMRSDLIDSAPEDRRDEVTRSVAGLNFTSLATRALERNLLDRTVESIDGQFADQALVRARLLSGTGWTMYELGLPARAEPVLARALAIFEAELGPDDALTLEARSDFATVLFELDRYDEALAIHRELHARRRRLLGDEHRDTLASLNRIGRVLLQQGKLDEAKPFLVDALERKRRVLGDDDASTTSALDSVARLQTLRGDHAAAEAAIREVAATYERRYGLADTRTLIAVKRVGEINWRQRKYADAEPFFQRALDGSRALLGDDHPDTLAAINDLGNLFVEVGRLDEAEPLLLEAVETKRRVLGDRHSSTMISLNNLSQLLQAKGRFRDALPYATDTYAICEETFGPDHENTMTAIGNLAQVHSSLDEHDEAIRLMRLHQERAPRVFGEGHPRIGFSAYNFGALLRRARKFDEALEAFEAAAELLRDAAAARRFLLGRALGGVGLCLVELERYVDAEQPLREAVDIERETTAHPIQLNMLSSYLGVVLTKQGDYAEAEPLLVGAADVLVEQLPTPSPNATDHASNAVRHVVALYEAWNAASPDRDREAALAQWRQRLERREVPSRDGR